LSGPETPPFTPVFRPARSIGNVVELLRYPRCARGCGQVALAMNYFKSASSSKYLVSFG
jgi:hypothetical protein